MVGALFAESKQITTEKQQEFLFEVNNAECKI